MFANVYFGIAIIYTHIYSCICYVNYDIFHGFDFNPVATSQKTVKFSTGEEKVANVVTTSDMPTEPWTGEPTTTTQTTHPTTPPTNISTTTSIPTIPYPKFLCPEDEKPFNIGAYEVPTQRDVALQVQRTLLKMFRAYQRRAMGLLHDIQEATKATSAIEKSCFSDVHYHRNLYKQCVKRVSNKCQVITKSIVTELERQRAGVSSFIDGTICTVKEMKADPLQVIKVLAMELASLKFALPGFLRLLGSCSSLCNDHRLKQTSNKKPVRHMTDQDLVIKHFLTKKSYIELIKGSK